MKQCIVFIANGFTQENTPLQPWRYLYEIVCSVAVKHEVFVITEGTDYRDESEWKEGFSVIRSSSVSARHQNKLQALIDSCAPTQIWWSLTPRSVAYWPTLNKINCEKYALVTCPLYTYKQLVRATMAGVPYDELEVLWKQRLIPRNLFARLLNNKTITKVFVQSRANERVLLEAGVHPGKLSLLRVGIDPEYLKDASTGIQLSKKTEPGMSGRSITFMYFGSVRKIRGFNALLDAFAKAVLNTGRAKLVILARGADENSMIRIQEQIEEAGLAGKVDIQGGWLSREQVMAHIDRCDVVVLPFVIVPSDVPIAILEGMARGKPVIGTAIDGIPELIEDRGLIVDPLNPEEFSDSIVRLVEDENLRKHLGENAHRYMLNYPDWHTIGGQALMEAGLND